ncbi:MULTISPECIES: enoyl-CoA hydratase-related protein [Mesorhizobium]|uniref:enoyl-CoA hydratase-related protein n=1 Tax=Mesorhizobium TaxID=68287 RepID=UPI0010A969A8|nr:MULTISPECIES: enoyl-CoA hydratase-related protein [Mesorhizobium]
MSEVVLERPSAGILVARMHRPDARNAMNLALRAQLLQAYSEADRDPKIKVLVLTGGDEVFVSGADIKEFDGLSPMGEMLSKSQEMWRTVNQFRKPVIAAVNGAAIGGGCELALSADLIIAGENAKFGQLEIRLGLMPGAGGTQRLVRSVGKYQAMRISLLGEIIPSDEALRMGMVSEVVPDNKVMERALEIARKIAGMSPVAVMQIKEVMLAGMDVSLDTAMALERKAFQLLFATEDAQEGVRAFIEKRKAEFKGK